MTMTIWMMTTTNHVIFRVYGNLSRSVPLWCTPEELAEWREYNELWRFGCAQFVDGKCVYRGYLKDSEIADIEASEAAKPTKAVRGLREYSEALERQEKARTSHRAMLLFLALSAPVTK